MPRPVPVVESRMEAQAAALRVADEIDGLRAVTVPMFRASLALGFTAAAEAKAAADHLLAARRAARRVADIAAGRVGPDVDLWSPGHGRCA